MKTFLSILTVIALGAVAVFFLTIFLIVFCVLLGLSFVMLLIWMINGTPFYVTNGKGEVVAEFRRFKRIK